MMMKKYGISQSGFTLIELMVSLVIGAMIIAAIFQVLINSNAVNRNTMAGNNIQEAGRFAMEFLTSDIEMAGSTRVFLADPANKDTPGADIRLGATEPTFEPIVFKTGTKIPVKFEDGGDASIPVSTSDNPETDRSKISGDVLVTSSYPPNGRGCDGRQHKNGELVTNVYWARGSGEQVIDAKDSMVDSLYCFSFSKSLAAPNNEVIQPLVVGIEAMEIQLFNTDNSRYMNPAESLMGANIDEVKVALLVRAKEALAAKTTTARAPQKYVLLDKTYQAATDTSERVFRQVYTTSAPILNRSR